MMNNGGSNNYQYQNQLQQQQTWQQQQQPQTNQYQQHYTPQQMYYQQPPQVPYASAPGDELKTLWIGNLVYWMDETYITSCCNLNGDVTNIKLIRNKQTQQLEGYGFVEFINHAAAERFLQQYNGTQMPNADQNYRLNWASPGGGEKRSDGTPEYTIFVGDLAADVTDSLLEETFKPHYTSVKGAKVVTDKLTGRPKGYGFVSFGDEGEQLRAMSEMNNKYCSSRPMRIGPAASKKSTGCQEAPILGAGN